MREVMRGRGQQRGEAEEEEGIKRGMEVTAERGRWGKGERRLNSQKSPPYNSRQ